MLNLPGTSRSIITSFFFPLCDSVFVSLQGITLTKNCHAGAIRQMLYLPNGPVHGYRGNKSL